MRQSSKKNFYIQKFLRFHRIYPIYWISIRVCVRTSSNLTYLLTWSFKLESKQKLRLFVSVTRASAIFTWLVPAG